MTSIPDERDEENHHFEAIERFLKVNRATNLTGWKEDIKTMEPKSMNTFVKEHFDLLKETKAHKKKTEKQVL